MREWLERIELVENCVDKLDSSKNDALPGR